jgi:hypothetical protein
MSGTMDVTAPGILALGMMDGTMGIPASGRTMGGMMGMMGVSMMLGLGMSTSAAMTAASAMTPVAAATAARRGRRGQNTE